MDSEPECPECGDEMVVRKNKATGEEFWGCTMYPYCNGTVAIEQPVKTEYPAWASDPANQ